MSAYIILFALLWAGQSQARSIMPPARDPVMWMLPAHSNHSSVDEWMRCHGMPCDVYERATRKLMLIKIGANGGDMYQDPMLITNPELLADDSLDDCIWLNEEQVDMMLDDMKKAKRMTEMESEMAFHLRTKRKVINFDQIIRRMWPKNEPVHWKFDGDHDALEQDMIRRGFEEWSEHTCLRFRELGVNEKFDGSYILVTEANTGCHSFVGRQDFRPQQLNLQAGCIYEVGIPIHEIGHALGLWHEQQRADRDTVMKINVDNVAEWLKAQFQPVRSLRTLGVPYDTTSVMHYKHKDGSVNGMSVMETYDPLYQYNMGQRTGISFADAKIINRAYCARSCVNELPCERGGYTDPNDCSKCKCPDGYGGTRCEKAADPVGALCGGDFFLNDGATMTITSPGYDTVKSYRNFQECNWVFKTGSGYRPNVEFIEDFRLHCHYQDVCYHWVELKYENSSEEAGPRFCCSRKLSGSITSQTDEMAIIFKSPWRNNDDRARRGFKAIITAVSTTTASPTTTPTTTTTTTTAATTPSPTTPTPPIQSYTNGPSPSSPPMGKDFEWRCDLELKGGKQDFCGMMQDEEDDQFDWTLMSGSTQSGDTGPSGASVGSYYMYIEASSPRKEGDRALITLPLAESLGLMCLTFDYSMYGFHTGALKVVIENSSGGYVQWSLSGEQGPEWKPAVVQVELEAGEAIGILGIRGGEYSGDIAVDNIQVVGRPC